ncbi:MAG: hypothetical protein JXR37_15835 [Kiritimatiellae bacterium]|nr:hypothetical protein [Kiritimatiellia bacterium]
MSAEHQDIIGICRQLMTELKPAVHVVRIYAYRSRVREDHTEESDLDLIVELHAVSSAAKRGVRDAAWRLSLDRGFVISAIVVSEDEFERGPLGRSPFAENVRRHGVEIAA